MRLTLSGAAALLLSFACKAESVGVEVRRGGPDRISMEDIRRDVFLLEANRKDRAPGSARPVAGWHGLTERLQEMKTLPAFGRSFRADAEAMVVCSEKRGAGDGVVLVGVEDSLDEPGRSTAGMAMLISLAKAWDTRTPPPRTILFCAWDGAAGFDILTATPPVPWSAVSSALLLGTSSRAVEGVSFDALETPFSGAAVALDFQAIQARTIEVEQVLRNRVTDDL